MFRLKDLSLRRRRRLCRRHRFSSAIDGIRCAMMITGREVCKVCKVGKVHKVYKVRKVFKAERSEVPSKAIRGFIKAQNIGYLLMDETFTACKNFSTGNDETFTACKTFPQAMTKLLLLAELPPQAMTKLYCLQNFPTGDNETFIACRTSHRR